jgi:hypothetical protein
MGTVFTFGFCLNLALDLLALTAIVTLFVRAGFSLGVAAGAVAPAALFSPFVFITSSHMETCLFSALLALSLVALQSGNMLACFTLAGLLAICRPEGFLLVGLALLIVLRLRPTFPWREAATAGAIVAPWLIFAISYFGHVVPQSALAKAPWSYKSLPQVLSTGVLVIPKTLLTLIYAERIPALPMLNFPGMEKLVQVLLVVLFFVGASRVLRRPGLREMALLFLILVGFYAFAAPNVLFPWYGIVPSLMFYPLVMLGLWYVVKVLSDRVSRGRTSYLRPLWGALCAALALGLLAGLFVRSQNLKFANQFNRRTQQEIGMELASESAPDATIMLEPIGYIGFYSDRYVYDLAGLVSPAISELRRRYPEDWYVRAIFSFSPQYLVLRKFELERNVCFVGEGRLFQSEEQRGLFFRSYHKIKEFSGIPGRTSEAGFLIVFQKNGTIQAEANH